MQDTGCQQCESCGYPYYNAGGCSEATDTVCELCTVCGPMEYEMSACAAGADRVCDTCATDSECLEPSPQCLKAARWWRMAFRGVQLR